MRKINDLKTSFDQDKWIEKKRYDKKAREILNSSNETLSEEGWKGVNVLMLPPLEKYYELISHNLNSSMQVLELGAGTGVHTRVAIETGAEITCVDISGISLEVLEQRFPKKVNVIECSMTAIPLEDSIFDYILCAGSLSYVIFNDLLHEVNRPLKTGGSLIFVDSLGNNPVYRLNRFLRYFRGQRSYSTLRNMPKKSTINKISKYFEANDVFYFGSYLWFLLPLSVLIPQKNLHSISESLERIFPSKKNAFKFVLHCQSLKK
jgi:ubiquinone/menaquinone biosynthesis C-methylase UbiE